MAKPNDSAGLCIAPVTTDRPLTPPELRKFRKSSKLEPGVHVVHWGLANDKVELNEAFGRKTKKDPNDNVGSVIASSGTSVLQQYLTEKKESIYESNKREPLGTHPKPTVPLPAFTQEKDFMFGMKKATVADPTTKELLFPGEQVTEENAKPKSRNNVDWNNAGIDLNTHRFGKTFREPTTGIPMTGVAATFYEQEQNQIAKTKIGPKVVDDFRNSTHSAVGKILQTDVVKQAESSGISFGGKKLKEDTWDAKQCIRGDYSKEDQLPDASIGKSKFFNSVPKEVIEQDRAFGCGSVRKDKAPPKVTSVANHVNYGNELGAADLLRPGKFASDGLGDEEFTKPVSADSARSMMVSIGYAVSDQEHLQILDVLNNNNAVVSLNNYRFTMNKVKKIV